MSALLRSSSLLCLTALAGATEEALDPWSYRDMEIYFLDAKTKVCYQINPGSRLAQGVAGIAATAAECNANWAEDIDLGNFDGYKSEKMGQHYSGGSQLGCSTWVKMFADDSLKALEGAVTQTKTADACDIFITIKAPNALLTKVKEEPTKAPTPAPPAAMPAATPVESPTSPEVATDGFRSDAPSSTEASATSGGGGAASVIVMCIMVAALVGCCVSFQAWRQKRSAAGGRNNDAAE